MRPWTCTNNDLQLGTSCRNFAEGNRLSHITRKDSLAGREKNQWIYRGFGFCSPLALCLLGFNPNGRKCGNNKRILHLATKPGKVQWPLASCKHGCRRKIYHCSNIHGISINLPLKLQNKLLNCIPRGHGLGISLRALQHGASASLLNARSLIIRFAGDEP